MSEQKEIGEKTVLTRSIKAKNGFVNDDSGKEGVYHPLARFILNELTDDYSEGDQCSLISLLDAGTGQKEFLDEKRPHFSKESLKKLRSLSSCDEDPPDFPLDESRFSCEKEGFPIRVGFPEDPSPFDREYLSDSLNADEPIEIPRMKKKESDEDIRPSEQIETGKDIRMPDQTKSSGIIENSEQSPLSEAVKPAEPTDESAEKALFILCDTEKISLIKEPEITPSAPLESSEQADSDVPAASITSGDIIATKSSIPEGSFEAGTVFPFYESRTPSGIFGRFLSLVEKRRNAEEKAKRSIDQSEPNVNLELTDSQDKEILSQAKEKMSEKKSDLPLEGSSALNTQKVLQLAQYSASDPEPTDADSSSSEDGSRNIIKVRDIAKKNQDNTIETPGEREEFQYLWRRLTRHQRHSLSVFLESLEY